MNAFEADPEAKAFGPDVKVVAGKDLTAKLCAKLLSRPAKDGSGTQFAVAVHAKDFAFGTVVEYASELEAAEAFAKVLAANIVITAVLEKIDLGKPSAPQKPKPDPNMN